MTCGGGPPPPPPPRGQNLSPPAPTPEGKAALQPDRPHGRCVARAEPLRGPSQDPPAGTGGWDPAPLVSASACTHVRVPSPPAHGALLYRPTPALNTPTPPHPALPPRAFAASPVPAAGYPGRLSSPSHPAVRKQQCAAFALLLNSQLDLCPRHAARRPSETILMPDQAQPGGLKKAASPPVRRSRASCAPAPAGVTSLRMARQNSLPSRPPLLSASRICRPAGAGGGSGMGRARTKHWRRSIERRAASLRADGLKGAGSEGGRRGDFRRGGGGCAAAIRGARGRVAAGRRRRRAFYIEEAAELHVEVLAVDVAAGELGDDGLQRVVELAPALEVLPPPPSPLLRAPASPTRFAHPEFAPRAHQAASSDLMRACASGAGPSRRVRPRHPCPPALVGREEGGDDGWMEGRRLGGQVTRKRSRTTQTGGESEETRRERKGALNWTKWQVCLWEASIARAHV